MSAEKKADFLQQAFDSRPVLTAFAYSILKDWSQAQDVFQEAVISMNEKIETIETDRPAKWLKAVIKNKSVDIVRKRERTVKRNEQISILLEEKFDSLLGRESVEVYKHKEKALHNCMAKLTPDSRNIIIDFYKSRFSCDKIGVIYKKSTNAIRLILSRSRSELRQCVKNQLEQS